MKNNNKHKRRHVVNAYRENPLSLKLRKRNNYGIISFGNIGPKGKKRVGENVTVLHRRKIKKNAQSMKTE